MDGVRTHDKFYLKENYKNKPKEYYKFVAKNIQEDFSGGGVRSFVDIGCETGSFLHYIHSIFPEFKLTGVDVMKELLDEVNKPEDIGATTILTDISKVPCTIKDQFDIVTMMGVIGIFDDFEPIIDNLLSITREHGCIYIFGVFNPEKLDMIMRCRKSGEVNTNWEKGWNIFSIHSMTEYCQKKGKQMDISEFSMPFAIEKNKVDPLRSWTVDISGTLMVINGLQLIHHFYLIKIYV